MDFVKEVIYEKVARRKIINKFLQTLAISCMIFFFSKVKIYRTY